MSATALFVPNWVLKERGKPPSEIIHGESQERVENVSRFIKWGKGITQKRE